MNAFHAAYALNAQRTKCNKLFHDMMTKRAAQPAPSADTAKLMAEIAAQIAKLER